MAGRITTNLTPPLMKFEPALLDAIRARLPVSQVVGRTVALKKQGREFAALSPFNSEKTPSFFVNDDKQFYHCFSSGKHGDIFTWLMETEGLSFPEAVERLADDAGVTLPKDDPRAARDMAQRAARSKTLAGWLEAAAAFFQDALAGPRGAEARRYLDQRGVTTASRDTFALGYAPDSRTALLHALRDQGAPLDALVEAGLVIRPDDGGAAYDRFRDRVMFPIRDSRGRLIAFGGRALNPNARAKYLNSPETALFDKSRTLYNYHAARAALARGAPASPDPSSNRQPQGLTVAEGYMDVIALAQAGFPTAVAPLGTALTEAQLDLLWRAGPEPVVCFDGDGAGRRAAARAADRALPKLKPGYSVRFALMPAGLDPDDLIRAEGPAAMAAALARAEPLDAMVWAHALEAGPADTPERRAGLRRRLTDAAGRIADETVQREFRRALLDRYYAMFRGASPRGPRQPRAEAMGPRAETKSHTHRLAQAAQKREAERLLAALLIRPELLPECAETLAELTIPEGPLTELRDVLVDAAFFESMLDKTVLDQHVARSGSQKAAAALITDSALAAAPIAPEKVPQEEAAALWLRAAERLARQAGLEDERADLVRELKQCRASGDRDRMARLLARLRDLHGGGDGSAT